LVHLLKTHSHIKVLPHPPQAPENDPGAAPPSCSPEWRELPLGQSLHRVGGRPAPLLVEGDPQLCSSDPSAEIQCHFTLRRRIPPELPIRRSQSVEG